MSRPRHVWFVVLGYAALTACDPAGPAEVAPAGLPTMIVAAGPTTVEVPFDRVLCSPEGRGTLVELVYPRAVPDGRNTSQTPRVLIARIDGDSVQEAHAFVPQARFVQTDYPMVQLVAGPAAPDSECRVERVDATTTLVCNYATIVPWLDPGERPRPSFKVSFTCPP